MSNYVVKSLVWHTRDLNYYYPAKDGEPPVTVSLEHLTDERIARLIDLGAVEPAGGKSPKKAEKKEQVEEAK